jgi:hypothetical protein
MSIIERDLAINKINKKKEELESLYKKIDGSNSISNGISNEEEKLKKKQIKRLNELYKYVRKNNNKNMTDQQEILNEISNIERNMRK